MWIGRRFAINGATIARRLIQIAMTEHPVEFKEGELDETIEVTLRAFHEKRPLTLPEIDAGIRANVSSLFKMYVE
jgi:hypothetical protein